MKTISHSGLRLWRNCPRQYKHQYINLRVPVKTANALIYGRHWDRALEAWHHAKGAEAKMLAGAKILGEIQDPILKAKTAGMLVGYTARWADAPVELVATQVKFTVPILHPETGEKHPDFMYTGVLDAIVKLNGRLLGFESKSSSENIEPGSPFWQHVMTLDPQVSMYLPGAEQAGYELEAILYDVARKPELRLKKDRATGKEESYEDFLDRIVADIHERPDYYYQRHEIVRLEQNTRAYLQDLWDYVTTLAEAERADRFPRNPDRCRQFGRACEYIGVCASEASIDDPVLYRAKERENDGYQRPNPDRTAA